MKKGGRREIGMDPECFSIIQVGGQSPQRWLEVLLPFSPHCNGNSVYIFISWELRGLSPSFHIHVSVRDLYVYSQDRSTYFLQQKRQTHRENVEIGTEAPIVLFWEYLFPIFDILSLQCISRLPKCSLVLPTHFPPILKEKKF